MTPKRLEAIRRVIASLEMAGGLASQKSPAIGAAAELLAEVDALREQRRVLREALEELDEIACRQSWSGNPDDLPEPVPMDGQEVVHVARAALDATKEEP